MENPTESGHNEQKSQDQEKKDEIAAVLEPLSLKIDDLSKSVQKYFELPSICAECDLSTEKEFFKFSPNSKRIKIRDGQELEERDQVVLEMYFGIESGDFDMLVNCIRYNEVKFNKEFSTHNPFIRQKHRIWTPMHFAAARNRTDMMILFLENGADGTVVTRASETVLHIAAKYGSDEAVDLILKRHPGIVDNLDGRGLTALVKCIYSFQSSFKKRYRRCVIIMLKAGCDPNISSPANISALHIAVEKGDSYIVEKLIQFKAEIDSQCHGRSTPLYRAMSDRHISNKIIQCLVRAGANPNQRMIGKSVFTVAICRCDETTVETFIEMGADPNHDEDNYSETPIWTAVTENTIKVVSLLVRSGLDFEKIPNRGDLITHAIANNSIKMVRLLLETGISENTALSQESPIHLATERGKIDIVKVLLGYNYSMVAPNLHTPEKFLYRAVNSPVRPALETGNADIVHLLMNAGCGIRRGWVNSKVREAFLTKKDSLEEIKLNMKKIPSLLNITRTSLRKYLENGRYIPTMIYLKKNNILPTMLLQYISFSFFT